MSCNINCNVCSCNASPPFTNNEPEDSSKVCKTFPPVSSDISNKPEIKEMDVLSNLENVRDLEFSHEFISDQIEKFAITPILCNNCNDLSKHFLDPAFYTNKLYVKNSKWILNSDSKLTMDVSPYK